MIKGVYKELCNQCKAFIQTRQELQEILANQENLIISKEEEVAVLSVEEVRDRISCGYPLISKKKIKYTIEFEVND